MIAIAGTIQSSTRGAARRFTIGEVVGRLKPFLIYIYILVIYTIIYYFIHYNKMFMTLVVLLLRANSRLVSILSQQHVAVLTLDWHFLPPHVLSSLHTPSPV